MLFFTQSFRILGTPLRGSSTVAAELFYYRTSCTYYLQPCRQSFGILIAPLSYTRVDMFLARIYSYCYFLVLYVLCRLRHIYAVVANIPGCFTGDLSRHLHDIFVFSFYNFPICFMVWLFSDLELN